MIIRLNGGLGNQMFQYAFGRALAEDLNLPLYYDLRELQVDPLRKFALDGFNHAGQVAPESALKKLKPGLLQKVWAKLKLPGTLNPSIVAEKSFEFRKSYIKAKGPRYYMGYWQSEKYFERHAGLIRNDFAFKSGVTEPVTQWAQSIKSCDSVSVHIRRGDYVANAHTNAYHGVCSQEYYSNALSAALKGLAQPKLFVFTDDPVWVKENMQWPVGHEIISGNGLNDWQDMYLMSQCRSIITANSSFSWWSAWLSGHDRVFVPQKWFNRARHGTDDLIPARWTRI